MSTNSQWVKRVWRWVSKIPQVRAAKLVGSVLPWVIAGGILAFVFLQTDTNALISALQTVSITKLLLLSIAFAVSLCLVDAFALFLAIRTSLGDEHFIPYRNVVPTRGVAMLFGLVNYGVGQASLIYLFHKYEKLPIVKATSAILLGTGCFLLTVAIFVGGAFALGALPDYPQFSWIAPLVGLGLALYFFLLLWKPRFLTRWSLFQPLFFAGIKGTLLVIGGRSLHLGVLVIFHWLAMNLFQVEATLLTALAAMPVIFLIAQIPIAPSGLGTTQAAAIALLSPFAIGATENARQGAVFAYSIAFHITSIAAIALVGLICLKLLRSRGIEPVSNPGS